MMPTIAERRIESVLSKLINYEHNGGILTRRQFMDCMHSIGATPEVCQVVDTGKIAKLEDELDFLKRHKREPSGNPHWPDTRRYYAIQEELKKGPTKTEYRIWKTDSSFHVVTKIEYDYFIGKGDTMPPNK